MASDDIRPKSNRSNLVGQGQRGGLYDGFEAYKTPSDDDYSEVLTQGLIVLDSSVLLNLYRYAQQTRNDFISVLRSFGNRIFVPHHVMIEFWRNREAVLKDPLGWQTTANNLANYREQSLNLIRNWTRQTGLAQESINEFSETLEIAFQDVIGKVALIAREEGIGFANNTDADPVLAELEPLLQGCVGEGLSENDYEQAVSEARRRAGARIPPGYMDAAKTADRAAGDYLIWLQVIHEAKTRKRDVLLVTGDVKEDWWRRERGELRGPRPELVREIKQEADVRLFMFRPESLLIHARRFLQATVQDESVQVVERVGVQEDSGPTALIHRGWDEILKSIKPRSKIAWLLLKDASIDEVTGQSVTVEFMKPSDAESFIERGLDRLLSDVIHEFFDIEPKIIVTPLRSAR